MPFLTGDFLYFFNNKESIIALRLIQGHKDVGVPLALYLAAVTRCEQLTFFNLLKIPESGFHLKAVAFLDLVPVYNFKGFL